MTVPTSAVHFLKRHYGLRVASGDGVHVGEHTVAGAKVAESDIAFWLDNWEVCPAGGSGLCWSGVCSKPDPKMRLPACVAACQGEAWNDCPKAWNSETSWLASLRRIYSKRLTTSFEYNRSPHRRQTSTPTVTDARLTPPRSSFSPSFRTISPPHTGHVLNGIILASLYASRANE